jgi:hypothetical protein
MQRTILAGVLLAALVLALALGGSVLSLPTIWPVLLVAAGILVPGGQPFARLGAFAVGATAGWVGFALRVTVFPDIALTVGLALSIAVLLVTGVSLATAGRLPLWAGLAGIAAFSGLYEAAYLADPTAFLTESAVAFTTLLLASAIGAAAGLVATTGAERAATASTDDPAVPAEETI